MHQFYLYHRFQFPVQLLRQNACGNCGAGFENWQDRDSQDSAIRGRVQKNPGNFK